MDSVKVVDHPILSNHLSYLRDKDSSPALFRDSLKKITYHLALEATKNLETKSETWQSPLENFSAQLIATTPLAISILRAGEGMVSAFLEICPMAELRHLGLYRDKKENKIIDYYNNIPNILKDREVFLLDPMLATGETAVHALSSLQNKGIKNIYFLCVLAAPKGIEKVLGEHPNTKIYTASIESALNEKNYILPGLGDAGDRVYNT